jgi:hypothetical protein
VEGTLADLAAGGLLKESDVIFATYKGQRYVATRYGENGLRLSDDVTYASLSTAARSIAGHPMNGWTFWKTEKNGKPVSLAVLRDQLETGVH